MISNDRLNKVFKALKMRGGRLIVLTLLTTTSAVISRHSTSEEPAKNVDTITTIEYTTEYTPNSTTEEPVMDDVDLEYLYTIIPMMKSEIDTLVVTCEENSIPLHVALGLIQVESEFNTYDSTTKKSNCYFQINSEYQSENLSGEDNIRYGIEYLGSKLNETGDLMTALDAYHNGHVTGDMSYPYKVMDAASEWYDMIY